MTRIERIAELDKEWEHLDNEVSAIGPRYKEITLKYLDAEDARDRIADELARLRAEEVVHADAM